MFSLYNLFLHEFDIKSIGLICQLFPSIFLYSILLYAHTHTSLSFFAYGLFIQTFLPFYLTVCDLVIYLNSSLSFVRFFAHLLFHTHFPSSNLSLCDHFSNVGERRCCRRSSLCVRAQHMERMRNYITTTTITTTIITTQTQLMIMVTLLESINGLLPVGGSCHDNHHQHTSVPITVKTRKFSTAAVLLHLLNFLELSQFAHTHSQLNVCLWSHDVRFAPESAL